MNRPLIALDARLLSTQNTGDTAYWRGLVKGLAAIESGLEFLLVSNSPCPGWLELSKDFEWSVVPGGGRFWSLWSFPREARRRGAQVIHAQYNLSPLIGKIGVTTIHDVSFFIGPEWFRPRDRFLLQRGIPATVRRAAKVLTVSETSMRDILRHVPCDEKKIAVTPNALGENVCPMPQEDAERIVRDRLKIAGPYVFTVGTRWPRKNMALAIDAVSLLPDSLPHKIVVSGGAGWGERALSQRTITTGYVQDEELTALYQCADLYIAPSRYEGFGIPLLEAWACDCPVVCSTGGALPEVASDAAVVIEGWDPGEWSNQIAALLSDSSKLSELRQKGKERLKAFSWEDTARKTVSAYFEVIG